MGSHLLEIKEGTVEITVCYPFPREWLNYNYPKVNVMMRFLILYVIPLTIIAIFYMNMANHLIVSTRNVPGEMQGTQRQVFPPGRNGALIYVRVEHLLPDQGEEESRNHGADLRFGVRDLLLAQPHVHAVLLFLSGRQGLLQRVLALLEDRRFLPVLSEFLRQSHCFVLGQRSFPETLQQVSF